MLILSVMITTTATACIGFLDWQLVRKKAAKMVEEMAYKAPELRDKMQYPRSPNSLYHFIPIGSKYVYMCVLLLFLLLASTLD